MSHSIAADREFILRILTFGVQAAVKSIVARNIRVNLFNFLRVIKFHNYNSMKLHFILGSESDLEDVVNAIDSELGIKFSIVENHLDISIHNPNFLQINWNSSVASISKQILWHIENDESVPPGAE